MSDPPVPFWEQPRVRVGDGIGQVDTTQIPRTAIPATFAGLPRIDEVNQLDAGVVGIPFDTGVSYRPGARFGPNHIRASSRLLRPYNPEADTWPFSAHQIADFGDIPAHPFDIAEAVNQIERGARDALERSQRILALGGDHSIALPLLRAVHAQHGPVAVVHFDAHLDTWEGTFNTPIQHGTPFRRASEEGLLDLEACMHIGTRGGLYGAADMDDDQVLGFATLRCDEFDLIGVRGVIERLHARVENRPVYVSVDIDVLDPAFAPGTGTPESGGLTSRELLTILRATAGLQVVSADIVEVSPAYDHAEVTGLAAAHVGYEVLSAWAPKLTAEASQVRTR